MRRKGRTIAEHFEEAIKHLAQVSSNDFDTAHRVQEIIWELMEMKDKHGPEK